MNVHIFDTTNNHTDFQRLAKKVLEQDMPRSDFDIIDGIVPEMDLVDFYVASRKQLNADTFLEAFHRKPEMIPLLDQYKIILLDYDLFLPGLNWFMGGLSNNYNYLTISCARAKNGDQLKDMIRHEIGHLFGAPSEGRNNTTECLGLHCVNDYCTMQQKSSAVEFWNWTQYRLKAGAPAYCDQCIKDIKNH
jgi:predicted Zn-dependent protease